MIATIFSIILKIGEILSILLLSITFISFLQIVTFYVIECRIIIRLTFDLLHYDVAQPRCFT